MSQSVGVWVAALATIGAYSYLYKENAFFRITEHLLIGLTARTFPVMGFTNIQEMAVQLLSGSKLWPIFPLAAAFCCWRAGFRRSPGPAGSAVVHDLSLAPSPSPASLTPTSCARSVRRCSL